PSEPSLHLSLPTRRSSDLSVKRPRECYASVTGLCVSHASMFVRAVGASPTTHRDTPTTETWLVAYCLATFHPSQVPSPRRGGGSDRKSTRLNSSHVSISYA